MRQRGLRTHREKELVKEKGRESGRRFPLSVRYQEDRSDDLTHALFVLLPPPTLKGCRTQEESQGAEKQEGSVGVHASDCHRQRHKERRDHASVEQSSSSSSRGRLPGCLASVRRTGFGILPLEGNCEQRQDKTRQGKKEGDLVP